MAITTNPLKTGLVKTGLKTGLKTGKMKVTQALNQARESIQAFEKETLAKAKSMVKFPSSADRKRLRNDRILSGLRKLGVATQDEVDTLNEKIAKLESAIRPGANSKKNRNKTAKKKKKA